MAPLIAPPWKWLKRCIRFQWRSMGPGCWPMRWPAKVSMAVREAARWPQVPDSPSPAMPASVPTRTKRNWPIETGVTAVIFMNES